MILLALAGRATVGKSTAATMLVKEHGFTRLSFATPLYKMLEAGGFGWPKTQQEKSANIPALERLGIKVTWRKAAQTLGTEWGRTYIDADVWTILALSQCVDPDGKYVFDDLRFENEATKIREAGGCVVHMSGRGDDIGHEATAHESEKGLVWAPEDYHLDNSGNLFHLGERLACMLTATTTQ